MLVKETRSKKSRWGSIPHPSLKPIGFILFGLLIWYTWDGDSKSAPFYTTWWFWTAVVLFVLSATFLIWNFVSKKKKQKAEQSKKEEEKSHDDKKHDDHEVEKHAHDDHAHHGDDWFTKWVTKWWTVIVFLIIVVGAGFIIYYAFFTDSSLIRWNDDEVKLTAKVGRWSSKIEIDAARTIHYEGYGRHYALKDDQGNIYEVGPGLPSVHIPNTGYLKVKSLEKSSFPVRFFYEE